MEPSSLYATPAFADLVKYRRDCCGREDWSRITSNVHVGPSSLSKSADSAVKPIAAGGLVIGGLRNISECAVPVIVVKRVDAHFKAARSHITYIPFHLHHSPRRPGHRVITEIHVARHEKVDFAIAVIVEKTASVLHSLLLVSAGRFAHLTESPIAVIVIQDVLSPIVTNKSKYPSLS